MDKNIQQILHCVIQPKQILNHFKEFDIDYNIKVYINEEYIKTDNFFVELNGTSSSLTWMKTDAECEFHKERIINSFFDSQFIIVGDRTKSRYKFEFKYIYKDLFQLKDEIKFNTVYKCISTEHPGLWNQKIIPIMLLKNVNVLNLMDKCILVSTDEGLKFMEINEFIVNYQISTI